MKLAIISNPDSANTRDLLKAAEKRNINCSVYALQDLVFDVEHMLEHEFFSHDAYLFRGYNRNSMLAQTLAQFLVHHGKTVIDRRLVNGLTWSKFREAVIYKNQNIPHIPTYHAGSVDAWQKQRVRLTYPVVVKDLASSKGKGVRLCQDEDGLLKEIEQHGFQIIIQDFVPMKFDIRIICIGDKVVGAIKRESTGTDFRTNVSLGGKATAYNLNDEERTLAINAHRSMENDISGVDITYNQDGQLCVIETNICPEWQGFKQATGNDVADLIIQYIAEK
jgi:RimK family alpha-L-glutamate ligase